MPVNSNSPAHSNGSMDWHPIISYGRAIAGNHGIDLGSELSDPTCHGYAKFSSLFMTLTSPIIFEPLLMRRVWGGRRLETLYGKRLPSGVRIGESWEIVDRVDAQS